MHVTKNAMARGASVVLLVLAVPAGAPPRAQSGVLPFAKSAAPPSYRFHMDVAMAMRHFPWLHFHMGGDGLYEPGESYEVHFTSVPWFVPKARHDFDLSMLDPLMWPKRYLYEKIAQQGDETTFALHAINDPGLREATVIVGPYGRARQVDATYSDGTHVQTKLTESNINGFLLPTTMTATIDEPHVALSANADFKDYNFSSVASTHSGLQ